jgi:hypothetical protein
MNLQQDVMQYVLDGVIEKEVDLYIIQYCDGTLYQKLTASFFCSVVRVSGILESDE